MFIVYLVRPGTTDFDQQGRIQGTLDIPLTSAGRQEVSKVAAELKDQSVQAIYTSPCQAAWETAELLGTELGMKVKQLDKLQNLDHGLWQGTLIDEVRLKQPKVYRQWQQHPETICPPEGEGINDVQDRIQEVLQKLLRKHYGEKIIVVAPEPLTTLIRGLIQQYELSNLWKDLAAGSAWEKLEVLPEVLVSQ